MRTPEPTPTSETPLSQDLIYALRYYLGGRRGLLALAAAATVGGLVFNWNWLVAIGAAPLLIAALPCLAMCALGLCMNRIAGRSSAPAEESTCTSREPEAETTLPAEVAPQALSPLAEAEVAERSMGQAEALESLGDDIDTATAGADDPTASNGLAETTIERS